MPIFSFILLTVSEKKNFEYFFRKFTLKAAPNNFLDSHPNFVKNGGGWEIFFFFFFLTALKNRSMLEDTLNTLKLSCETELNDIYQRTNGPVNAHLISGPTVSTKTSFANLNIVLKWVKVNSESSFL